MKPSTIVNSLRVLSDRQVRGDLVCTQCARVAGTAEGSGARHAKTVTIRVVDPAHGDAVRRLCCPHCSARLWLQNSENARDNWHALDSDALRPHHGRPPKTPSRS